MKNIYDLEGNFYEWTQEASDASIRTARGGDYYSASYNHWASASCWSSTYPTSANDNGSSRPALYVTL